MLLCNLIKYNTIISNITYNIHYKNKYVILYTQKDIYYFLFSNISESKLVFFIRLTAVNLIKEFEFEFEILLNKK